MIEEISIANIGVIERATLTPGPGLTVLTGETGAGKTMVLTSIGLLLGRKADPGLVRHGAHACTVDGRFVEPEDGPAHAAIRAAGGLVDDEDLILARTVPQEGRSKAHAGGRLVPAGLLAEAGAHLVTVHGQSDQVALAAPATQRDLLDAAGGEAHARALADYRAAWAASKAAEDALAQVRARQEAIARERAELVAGLQTWEALAPEPGEDERLRVDIDRMANVEDLRLAATLGHDALSSDVGDDDVLTRLGALQRALDGVSGLDPDLGALGAEVRQCEAVLSDVAAALSSYLDDLHADPAQLAASQQRLADLTRACAPYGGRLADFEAWCAEAARRLQAIDDPGASIEAHEAECTRARERLAAAAEALHSSRVRVAEALSAQVAGELAQLAMADAGFGISVSSAEPASHGADTVAFTLSGPAGVPRGIGQCASGGELSRLMLALEVALISRRCPHGRPTLIFDEVDAGIGGATASAVGERLAALAQRYQVLVVTHLAQVAAFATCHLSVSKHEGRAQVATLTGEERVREIARMLAGDEDSEAARAHAAELLSAASSATTARGAR